jgi:hypothetical protein
MKRIFILFLFTSVCFICFTQKQERSYKVRTYSAYQKLLKNPQVVEHLTMYFNSEAIDSANKFGLEFNHFNKLVSFDIVEGIQDSVFEAFIFNKLNSSKTLESLTLQSEFYHTFEGFENVKTLIISNEKAACNPNLKNFESISRLTLYFSPKEPLSRTAGFLNFTQLKIIGLYGNFFPSDLDLLDHFTGLIAIDIDSDSIIIPSSWSKLQQLKSLSISRGEVKSIPNFFCELTSLIYIDIWSFSVPHINECLFQKENLNLSIIIHSKKRAELRKLKRYKKTIQKKLPSTREIYIIDRVGLHCDEKMFKL